MERVGLGIHAGNGRSRGCATANSATAASRSHWLISPSTTSAGPLFATMLAAATVVVLDFVANWLLRKLASAARKVGAKLKGMVDKFKARAGGQSWQARRSGRGEAEAR